MTDREFIKSRDWPSIKAAGSSKHATRTMNHFSFCEYLRLVVKFGNGEDRDCNPEGVTAPLSPPPPTVPWRRGNAQNDFERTGARNASPGWGPRRPPRTRGKS